jgi:PilZ domain-containing protein
MSQRELRKAKRVRRRNAAWIMLSSGGVRIPCVLWDVSDGGARIAAARASSLPQVFCLLMGNDGQSRRFCRVVWRKGGQVGVRFIDEAEADMDLDAPTRYPRHKQAPAPPAAAPTSVPHEEIVSQLVLPGCGPRVVREREPRAFAFSSVALGLVLLLGAATALFAFAGMQSDAPWALEVCERAGNFCTHPEWTIAAGAVMTVVYLAVKGMEL